MLLDVAISEDWFCELYFSMSCVICWWRKRGRRWSCCRCSIYLWGWCIRYISGPDGQGAKVLFIIFVIRPLPWQVRLHGRSTTILIKWSFSCLEGRSHGDFPGSPLRSVSRFLLLLFALQSMAKPWSRGPTPASNQFIYGMILQFVTLTRRYSLTFILYPQFEFPALWIM